MFSLFHGTNIQKKKKTNKFFIKKNRLSECKFQKFHFLQNTQSKLLIIRLVSMRTIYIKLYKCASQKKCKQDRRKGSSNRPLSCFPLHPRAQRCRLLFVRAALVLIVAYRLASHEREEKARNLAEIRAKFGLLHKKGPNIRPDLNDSKLSIFNRFLRSLKRRALALLLMARL